MVPADHAGTDARSLAEVHSSVGTGQVSFWRRLFGAHGGIRIPSRLFWLAVTLLTLQFAALLRKIPSWKPCTVP